MFPKNRLTKSTLVLAFVVVMAGLGYFLFYFNEAQRHGPAQVDDSIDRSLDNFVVWSGQLYHYPQKVALRI